MKMVKAPVALNFPHWDLGLTPNDLIDFLGQPVVFLQQELDFLANLC